MIKQTSKFTILAVIFTVGHVFVENIDVKVILLGMMVYAFFLILQTVEDVEHKTAEGDNQSD